MGTTVSAVYKAGAATTALFQATVIQSQLRRLSMAAQMEFWLYLYFPQLQLDKLLVQQHSHKPQTQASNQAAHKANPTDLTAPLAIVGADHQLLQLNSAAKKAGLTLGMGLASAASLCHQLQLIPHQAEQEQHQLQQLAQLLYQYCADIALQADSGLVLKLSPMLALYGGAVQFWQQLQQVLQQMGYQYHFATAQQPLVARLLAQQGWDQFLLQPDKIQQQLKALPLQHAQLADHLLEQFHRLGLKKLGDLLQIPQAELVRRFGIDMLQYLQQLTGAKPALLQFIQPAEQFEQQLELLYEMERSDQLLGPLKHLFGLLQLYLQQRDQLAYQLELCLLQRQGQQQQLQLHSAQGEYQSKDWLKICELQLERLVLKKPVIQLKLRLGRAGPRYAQYKTLFAGKEQLYSALQLLSLLQARLGKDQVTSPCLHNDLLPEQASGYTTALEPQAAVAGTLAAVRPLFLVNPPVALTPDQQQLLQTEYGPERLSSGWWQPQSQHRDYYVAQNTQGQWLWLYRDLQQPEQLYLQGYFS
jgi:protein ImuB